MRLWGAFFASTGFSRTLLLESGTVGWHKLQSAFALVRLWGGPVPLAALWMVPLPARPVAGAALVPLAVPAMPMAFALMLRAALRDRMPELDAAAREFPAG